MKTLQKSLQSNKKIKKYKLDKNNIYSELYSSSSESENENSSLFSETNLKINTSNKIKPKKTAKSLKNNNIVISEPTNTINLTEQSIDKELLSGVNTKDNTKDNTMNLSKQSIDKELLSEELCLKDNTINLSKQSIDKELFSEVNTKDNTMNLSELSIDKELLSGVNTKDNKINFSELSIDKELFSEKNVIENKNIEEILDVYTEKLHKEPSLLENINLEKYFHKTDIETSILNNKKLQISDKGLYSISKYYDADWISEIIVKFLKNVNIVSSNETIIDATSGIGGNTINFSKFFKKVHSIEINNTHFHILNNNLNALGIYNVSTYCENFLNIIDKIDIYGKKIIFFDPPWGGSSYKHYQYFNLKIGTLHIYDVLNKIYDCDYKYVILKAPINLNLSMIYSNIKYQNMNVHTNLKKNMIIVIFY